MTNDLKILIKKDKLNAQDLFDFKMLSKDHKNFVSVKISQQDENNVEFSFNLEEYKQFVQIQNLDLRMKIRLLINVLELEYLVENFDFSLNPKNLFYDEHYKIKILTRDLRNQDAMNLLKFQNDLLALIIHVINPKISFENARVSLNDSLVKHKLTQKFSGVQNLNDIKIILQNEYLVLDQKHKQQIIEVSKKKYFDLKFITIVTSTILTLAIILGVYFGLYKLNQEYVFNQATQVYINEDYSEVINVLKMISPEEMDNNTLFILAVSEIKTSAMNSNLKNQFINQISINSNSDNLKFWDYISQDNYDKALEKARLVHNLDYQQIIVNYKNK